MRGSAAAVSVAVLAAQLAIGAATAHAAPADAGAGEGAAPAADDAAIAEIRRLMGALEYERALVLVDREIAKGTSGRVRLVELHVLAGSLAAGIDHPEIAERHFAVALALAPATRLPDGTSPKVGDPFAAAKAKTVVFAVAVHRDGQRVVADVGADPAALLAGLRVHVVDPHGVRTIVAATGRTAELADGLVAETVDAVDDHGNTLDTVTLPAPAPRRDPSAPASPSLVGRWTTWAAVGGVALAGAGLCAWRFGVAQDEWNRLDGEGGHDFSTLKAVEDRGRRWGIAADIGFGLTAVAGLAAVIAYATHRDAEPPASQLAIIATSTGTTVGFATRF